jgi:hypothetical protein
MMHVLGHEPQMRIWLMPVGRVFIYNIECFFISSAFPFAANYDANSRRFVPDEYLISAGLRDKKSGFYGQMYGIAEWDGHKTVIIAWPSQRKRAAGMANCDFDKGIYKSSGSCDSFTELLPFINI